MTEDELIELQLQHREDAESIRAELKAVQLGLDIEQFMGTRIGQYLRKRSEDAMYDACQALATVDPTDQKAVIKLQTEYAVAQQAILWMAQAMREGTQAEQAVKAREHTD